MEIHEVILDDALKASQNSSIHSELDAILAKFKSKSIEEILFKNESDEDERISYQIHDIIVKNINTRTLDKNELSQIIHTAKHYLQKGISETNIVDILIFLNINCYFKIKIRNYITDFELQENLYKQLSEKILKLLLNVKLETHAPQNAPYHEKELLQTASEGFLIENLEKTYSLILGMERSGRGFHFNFLLENIIDFLFQINFTKFLKALNNLANPQTIVFYLQSFQKENILKLANEPSIKNKWINFEIIRQIIEKEQRTGFELNELEAVKNTFERIIKEDFNFTKQVIVFFNRSKLFNASLGELLVKLTQSQIEDIVSSCFAFDNSHSNIDIKNVLKDHFNNNSDDNQKLFFYQTIFNKWNSYFDSLFKLTDFYQNDILLTDYADFILIHYELTLTENDIIIKIDELANKIKFIDTEWSISESNQKTKFNLYYSQLYLLFLIFEHKKIENSDTENIFEELNQNTLHKFRYLNKDKLLFYK